MSVVPVAIVLTLVSAASAAEDLSRPITGAKSVLAIYTFGFRHSANGLSPHRLIFAAWDDGRVLWSENSVQGGIPYREGKIDPARLRSLLEQMAKDGLFGNKLLEEPKFGFDASTTVIYAKSVEGTLKMQSWHELYESNGKVVATQNGLGALDGRSKFSILAKQPAEYLFYRLAWNELRLGAALLIPTESKPVDGKLIFRNGSSYWLHEPAPKP
jgi:hypothetical protein